MRLFMNSAAKSLLLCTPVVSCCRVVSCARLASATVGDTRVKTGPASLRRGGVRAGFERRATSRCTVLLLTNTPAAVSAW